MQIGISIQSRAGKQAEPMTMKVWPRDDVIRNLIKHPTHGGFLPAPETMGADWPNDTFTFRRMRDGDILDHDPNENGQAPVAEAVDERPAEKPKTLAQPKK